MCNQLTTLANANQTHVFIPYTITKYRKWELNYYKTEYISHISQVCWPHHVLYIQEHFQVHHRALNENGMLDWKEIIKFNVKYHKKAAKKANESLQSLTQKSTQMSTKKVKARSHKHKASQRKYYTDWFDYIHQLSTSGKFLKLLKSSKIGWFFKIIEIIQNWMIFQNY